MRLSDEVIVVLFSRLMFGIQMCSVYHPYHSKLEEFKMEVSLDHFICKEKLIIKGSRVIAISFVRSGPFENGTKWPPKLLEFGTFNVL